MIRISLENGVLDLYDNVSIELSATLADVRDVIDKSSLFSFGLKIPATPNNNQLFGYLYDMNVVDDINVNLKIPITISYNNTLGIEGNLQIVSTKKDVNGELYYNCNILGKNNDIFSAIKNKQLNDLDLSGLTHTYTKSNIASTWTSGTPNYFYPYIEYGKYWSMDEIKNDGVLDNDGVSGYTWMPAIKAKYLWEKIWEESGYNVLSTFLSTDADFDNLYIPYTLDSLKFTSDSDILTDGEVNYYFYFEYDHEFVDSYTYEYFVGAAAVYDPLNDWNYTTTSSNTNQKLNYYDVPQEGIYTITMDVRTVSFSSDLTSTSDSVTYELRTVVDDILIDKIILDPNDVDSGTTTIDRELLYEDTIYVKCVGDFNTAVSTQDAIVDYQGEIKLSVIPKHTKLILNYTQIDFTQIVPNIEQLDFIKTFINMYNLHIEKESFSNNYIVEPRDIYYSGGTSYDWSDKIDIDGEWDSSYFNDLDIKNYNFKYKDGDDYENQQYQELNEITFGTKEVEMENDFSKNDRTIELSFAPTINKKVDGSYYWLVPHLTNDNNLGTAEEQTNWEPRLLFKNNITLSTDERFTFNSSLRSVLYTLSHNSELIPTDTDFVDINFTTLSEPTGILTTQQNLYELYWSEYVNYINSKDTEVLVADFNLTYEDFIKLKFNDRFYIRYFKSWFILNKIEKYILSSSGDVYLTKLELIKEQVGGAGDTNVSYYGKEYNCDNYYEGDTIGVTFYAKNNSEISTATVAGTINFTSGTQSDSWTYSYKVSPTASRTISHTFCCQETGTTTIEATGSYAFTDYITVNDEADRWIHSNTVYTNHEQYSTPSPFVITEITNNSCEPANYGTLTLTYDSGSGGLITDSEYVGLVFPGDKTITFNDIQIPLYATLGTRPIYIDSDHFHYTGSTTITEYYSPLTSTNEGYTVDGGYDIYDDEVIDFHLTLNNNGYKDVPSASGYSITVSYPGYSQTSDIDVYSFNTDYMVFNNITLSYGSNTISITSDYPGFTNDSFNINVKQKPTITSKNVDCFSIYAGQDIDTTSSNNFITNGSVAATYSIQYTNTHNASVRTISNQVFSSSQTKYYNNTYLFGTSEGYGESGVVITMNIYRDDGKLLTSDTDTINIEATRGSYEYGDIILVSPPDPITEQDNITVRCYLKNPGYYQYPTEFDIVFTEENYLSHPYSTRNIVINDLGGDYPSIPARAGYDGNPQFYIETTYNSLINYPTYTISIDTPCNVEFENVDDSGTKQIDFDVLADIGRLYWASLDFNFSPEKYNWGAFPTGWLYYHYPLDTNGVSDYGSSNFTSVNMDWSNAGKIDTCATFDGVDARLVKSSSIYNSMNFGNDGSFGFWVYPEYNVVAERPIITDKTSKTGNGFMLTHQYDYGGEYLYKMYVNNESAVSAIINQGWTYMFFNFRYVSASESYVDWYVNGVLETTLSYSTYLQNSGLSTQVGYDGSTYGKFRMDELTFWQEPLTETQIGSLYGNGYGCPYPGGDGNQTVGVYITNQGTAADSGTIRFDIPDFTIGYNDVSTGSINPGDTTLVTTTFTEAEMDGLRTQITGNTLRYSAWFPSVETGSTTIYDNQSVYNWIEFDYGTLSISPSTVYDTSTYVDPTQQVKISVGSGVSSISKTLWFSHQKGTGPWTTKTATVTISDSYTNISPLSFSFSETNTSADIFWDYYWNGNGTASSSFFTFYVYDHSPNFSGGIDGSWVKKLQYYPTERTQIQITATSFTTEIVECDESGPMFGGYDFSGRYIRITSLNTFTNTNVRAQFSEIGVYNSTDNDTTFTLGAGATSTNKYPSSAIFTDLVPIMSSGSGDIASSFYSKAQKDAVTYDTHSVAITYRYCLDETTYITMGDGSQKMIKDIVTGDTVQCMLIPGLIDQDTPGWSNFTYTGSTNNFTTGTTTVSSNDGGSYSSYYNINNGYLKCTYEHPFWIKRDGVWMWRKSEQLTTDDLLIDKWNNRIVIDSIVKVNSILNVYKLDVEDNDTYFANNILVHNPPLKLAI